jgi:glycosyltransferase involved in cell wall biosynthesis
MSENSYRLKGIHYFAVSTYVRMILELIYKVDVLSPLVPGGVDPKLFKPQTKGSGKPRLLFLSRGNEFRGSADIVAALLALHQQGIDLDCIVMGHPLNLQGMPHTLVPPLPQPEFAALLGTVDIFVHGSHFEGLPLPPLEAMASKCAVISTYIGASDYLLNNFNALVIPPKRPDMIADAIQRLVNRSALRDKLASNGYDTVMEGYTWEHTADRFEDALREGMARQGIQLTTSSGA